MYKIYQVEIGETLNTIANKVGSDVNTLRQLNGFSSDFQVEPNMYIIVPSPLPTQDMGLYQTYIVKKGDNMYDIAQTYQVDYQTLLRLNGLNENEYIYPDQEIIIPRKGVQMYVTEEYDTINSLTNKMNIPLQNILNQNLYLIEDQIVIYKEEENA